MIRASLVACLREAGAAAGLEAVVAVGDPLELQLRRQGVARHLLGAPERFPLALQVQLIAEALQSNTGSQQRGRRSGQAVDQPLLSVTPLQKATRPRISSAAALGSG